jgi:DNA-binding NarL/FixJ family response regulator
MSVQRGRVLLAEPDQVQREQLTSALSRVGFTVDAVNDGKAAAQTLQLGDFDVLLAESHMPGNSHLELVSVIRDHELLLPVILMTGQPSVDTAVDALRLGVLDYITTPPELDELVDRLDTAISKGRAVRALADAEQRALVFTESVAALERAITVFSTATPAALNPSSRPPYAEPLAQLSAEELARLSPREREIARLLALGKAVLSIATTLALSPNTVRNHIKSIFAKLRVHSQLALLSKLAGHRQ